MKRTTVQGTEANENHLNEEVAALRARAATLEQVNRRLAKQQNSDESLNEAWTEWERTFDASKDSIMVLDGDFKIIQANLATSRFSSKPLEEIIGQPCWQIVHGNNGPCTECPLKVAQSTKSREEAQLYVPERDTWVEVLVDPILDDQGRIAKVIHIVRDTTKQKQAMDALAATEYRFRSICDNANEVIVFVSKLGKILEVNNRVKDILGYGRDELIGRNFLTSGVLAAKNAPMIVKLFKEAVNGGGFPGNRDGRDVTEVWLNHKSGHTILVEASTAATRNNGKLEGFVSILRDITERRKVGDALKYQEQELEMRNRIVDVFLTMPDEQMYAAVLEIVLEVLASKYGTFGYFDETGAFVAPALTREAWLDNCNVAKKKVIFERRKWSDIFAQATDQKKVLFSNDGHVNTPKGHILIENTMVAPIVYHEKVISAIHIANKSGGYNEQDRRLLETIGKHIAPILNARLERDKEESRLRKTEESLRESEEHFRGIFENAAIGMYRTTPDGQILMANSALVKMLGYASFEELAQRNLEQEGFEPAYPRSLFKQVIETTGHVVGMESHWLRRNGTVLFVRESARVVQDDVGNSLYYEGTVEDITEAMKTREREAQYIRELEFLSESAASFAQFPLAADLHGYIASRLKELVPDAIIAVSSYERQSGGLRLRELLGLGSRTQAVVKLMGANPVGRCFEIDDQAREGLSRGELEQVPGGIYDLSPGIPRAVCQALEKLLGLGRVYGMGLSWKGELLGSIIILTHSRNELSNKSCIQAFIRQAAVALQRSEAEKALQESQERLEAAIDAASLGTWDWDLTTGHIVWAGHHDRLFGFAPGEFDGRYETFESRVHPDDVDGLRQAVERSLRDHIDYAHEYRVMWPDGTTRWVAGQGRHQRDQKGRPMRMLGTVSDITDRKRAEGAHRSLVDHSLQGLVIFQEGRVAFANRAMAEICGYTLKEMLEASPEKVRAFVHPDDQELVWNRHQQRLNGEVLPERYEIRGIRKDGSVCWLEIQASPIEYQGKPAIQAAYIDITERKKTEHLLRDSQRRYAEAAQRAKFGHWERDFAHDSIIWSNEIYKTFGVDAETFDPTYEDFLSLVHPSDRESLKSKVRETLASCKRQEIEYRIIRPDGEERWIHSISDVVRDERGKGTKMIGTVHDITKRKMAEQALLKSKEQLKTIFDSAVDGIVYADRKGNVIKVNPAFTKITGLPREQVVGGNSVRLARQFGKPKDLPKLLKAISDGLVGKPVRIGELGINNRVIEIVTPALKKEMAGITAVIRDVTDQKAAERALRESELRLRILFEYAPDAIYLIDLEGTFIEANKVAEELTGYPRQELIGSNFAEMGLLRPEDIPRAVANLGKLASGKPTGPDEYTLRKKDGTEIVVEIRAYPVKIDDQTLSLGIARDITERKKAEEALWQSKAYIESLNNALVDAIFTVKLPEREIEYVNNATERMFGYTAQECTGQKTMMFYPSEEAFLLLGMKLESIIEQGKDILHVEQFLKRKDGELFPAEITTTFLKEGDKVVRVISIIRDITERKKAEHLLQKERDKAQKYLDVAAVMMVAVDSEQRVGLINDKGSEILGYAEEEIIGKNWFDNFLPARVRDEVKAVFEKFVKRQANAPEYYENPILTQDGRERLIAWHNTMLRDDQGNFVAILSSGEDITERRKAAEALRNERDRLYSLLDGLPGFVYLTAPDHSIAFANKYFRDHFGDPQAKRCYEVLWGRERPCEPCKTSRVLHTRTHQVWEWSESPDGRIYEVHDYPFMDHDGTELVLELGIDVTERKKAEEALKRQALLSGVFLDSMPCVALLLRPQTREIVAANRQAEDVGAVSGTTCYGAWAGREDPCPWCLAPEVWNTGQRQHLVVEYKGVIWDAHWVPIEEDLYLHYAFDITQRSRVEEALRESEERYRSLFEGSLHPITIYNRDADIVMLNDVGAKNLKKPLNEIIGRSLREFIPENHDLTVKRVRNVLESGKPLFVEDQVCLPEGRRWFLSTLHPVAKSEGQADLVQVISYDITKRKQAEERLLEYQAKLKAMSSEILRAEDRERKRLAIGLHDNICQKLVLTKLAVESYLGLISDAKLSASLRIASAAIGEVIEETDSLTFELSNPILRELGFVAAIERYLNDEIRKKHGIQYELERGRQIAALPDEIGTCLFRIARELLTNVVKHAHASKIKVSIDKSQGWIRVGVQDNGIGFGCTETVLESSKNTRFGLFSIREQLEVLGGYLDIESEASGGATVTVLVPLEEKTRD